MVHGAISAGCPSWLRHWLEPGVTGCKVRRCIHVSVLVFSVPKTFNYRHLSCVVFGGFVLVVFSSVGIYIRLTARSLVQYM